VLHDKKFLTFLKDGTIIANTVTTSYGIVKVSTGVLKLEKRAAGDA